MTIMEGTESLERSQEVRDVNMSDLWQLCKGYVLLAPGMPGLSYMK